MISKVVKNNICNVNIVCKSTVKYAILRLRQEAAAKKSGRIVNQVACSKQALHSPDCQGTGVIGALLRGTVATPTRIGR